jgi:hypothetical protein
MKPPGPEEKSRLTPIDRSRDLLPWRKAERVASCSLYWMPVRGYPMPAEQKQWLMVFLDRLAELLGKQQGVQPEVFLQFKVIYPDLLQTFTDNSFDLYPFMGLSRRPGSELPPPPTMEKDVVPIQQGKKKFDFGEFIGDYCYWFVFKDDHRQREMFLGHGGMSILYLKPDPKAQAAPVKISPKVRANPKFGGFLEQFNVDKVIGSTGSLQHEFLAKSKKLFGAGLEKRAEWRGLLFIIPLLRTSDFFDRPEQERQSWFQVFDYYVNESPEDKGILFAAKGDFDQTLIDMLRQMRDDGLRYPER